MNENNVALAEAYYTAMRDQDISGVEKYLHPDVHFVGPLGEMKGKEAVVAAASKAITLFKSLTIRTKFGSGDQAMLVYDLDPELIGNLRVAALMSFQENLIAKIELFYDGRPFDRKEG